SISVRTASSMQTFPSRYCSPAVAGIPCGSCLAQAIAPARTWSVMPTLTKNSRPTRAHREPLRSSASSTSARIANGLRFLLAAAVTVMTIALSACGGGSSSDSQQSATLSGNWKFTVSAPSDNSFSGGLQGGFLLQNNGSVSGAAVYSVSAPALPAAQNPCNSGSAPITGTISNLNVTLTAVAGSQTFTFTGALSSDGSTMNGTYASTAGTAADGTTPC